MDRQILRYNFEYDGLYVYNQNNDKYRNSSIFQTINTEEKAYWLGLMYADGYVNEKENRIELTLKDREHIEKFKLFINAQNKIYIKKAMGHEYYRICLRDKKMTLDLVKKGCFQNKSLNIRFPTLKIVPEYLQKHFIRGYFDGDGCLCYSTYGLSVQIISTKEFLNKLTTVANLKRNKYSRCGQAYQWQNSSQPVVNRFLNYIYKDAKIYLDRKYNKYLQYAVLDRDI